ncbi:MAG TPA: nucleotide exchange factor GrpE [Terriglobales bacterium]|nr:nucleotide exchange factor GrpE [Terriglobales bacterium]
MNREALDLDHELPASDDAEEQGSQEVAKGKGAAESSTTASELEKIKAERDTLLDRLARLQAEFENARKRAAKEQQDFREYAQTDAIKALLPILDSFERALRASSSEAGEFRSGIELIYKQLQDALSKLGVRPIPAKGEPFDPHLHQAIEMVETSEVPDHHVVEELQRGYKLKDRLLRPSMVKVAKNSKTKLS